MNKALSLMVTAAFLATTAAMAIAGEKAPQKVVELSNARLAALGTDPVIVKAVQAENAKGKTLEQIQTMDRTVEGPRRNRRLHEGNHGFRMRKVSAPASGERSLFC